KNRTPRPVAPAAPAEAAAASKPPGWYERLPDLPPLQGRPLGERDWHSYFGHAFVINLDRRPDRMEAFTRGLPADWPFVPVERVSAVDGATQRAPAGWRSGRGAYGLYLTYRDILQRGIDE